LSVYPGKSLEHFYLEIWKFRTDIQAKTGRAKPRMTFTAWT
jgi:hypothetical protein